MEPLIIKNTRAENAEAKVLKLRNALIGIVGASDEKELRGIEAVIRGAPIPDADKASTINAINAIIDTQ